MKRVGIRDMIGKPYVEHGRGPDGYDCYGVVIEFYGRAGIRFPDAFYSGPEREGLADEVREAVMHGLPARRIDGPEYGCLVELELGGSPHVGVYLDGGRFFHATRNAGVCVQDIGCYGKLVKGYWRVCDG